MKCPHCYCNYDDSETECPMCGKRAGFAAYQRGKRQTAARTARMKQSEKRAGGRTNSRTYTANGRTVSAPNRGGKKEKPRSRRLWLVLLVIFVMQALVGPVMEIADDFSSSPRRWTFTDDGFGFSSREPDVPMPAAPEPEDTPDEPDNTPDEPDDTPDEPDEYPVAEALPGGSYAADGDIYWYFYDDVSYGLDVRVPGKEITEEGEYYLFYSDPEENMSYYNEEFPPETFDGFRFVMLNEEGQFQAVLYLDRNELAGGNYGFYLYNMFGKIPWLPLDQPVRFEYEG